MSKFKQLQLLLQESGLMRQENTFRPGRIKTEWLQLAHDSNYIDQFENNQLDAKAMRKMGLPWSEGLVKRSMISPNGTLMTAAIALNHGIACHLAGGTHHAHYDHGRGYCVFNDLAVTAKVLLAQGKVNQVLIFDCDVHQGDGTAQILADEDRAFTCSVHCQKNFPHHKATSNLDVGLPNDLGDEDYLEQIHSTLIEAIERCQPDLVLYDAGVDVFSDDDLGLLNISLAGLYQRERLVLQTLKDHNLPVATVIGGGYDKDQKALAQRHALVFQAASELYQS